MKNNVIGLSGLFFLSFLIFSSIGISKPGIDQKSLKEISADFNDQEPLSDLPSHEVFVYSESLSLPFSSRVEFKLGKKQGLINPFIEWFQTQTNLFDIESTADIPIQVHLRALIFPFHSFW